MTLLVVEDNEKLSALIKKGLGGVGMMVDVVETAVDAHDAIATNNYDAIILDLGLPDEDGLSLLREIRRAGAHVPVLILTARGGLTDRVEGLDAGADDYLVKPFALEELTARINAVLRRPSGMIGRALKLGKLVLDTSARQVFVNEKPQVFSAREIAILECLMRRSGRAVSKVQIESNLYGMAESAVSNAVEVYIHRLRRRLSDLHSGVHIYTLRGLGYIIGEDAE